MSKNVPAALKRQAFEILRNNMLCFSKKYSDDERYNDLYLVELKGVENSDWIYFYETKENATILQRAFDNLPEDSKELKQVDEPIIKSVAELEHYRKIIKDCVELLNIEGVESKKAVRLLLTELLGRNK